MANSLKLSAGVQNVIVGGTTTPRVRHKIEEISLSYSGKDSFVHTVTGTTNNSIATFGGALLLNGVTQKHPITGATIAISKVNGFVVTVERAVAATAPTGDVDIALTLFCGWTTSAAAPIKEDGFLYFHNPDPSDVVDSTLTLGLNGTTGYRINAVVWYTPA